MPGTRSSPANGVTVRACYGVSDSDPNLLNCTTNATQTLTVAEPLSVTIGTNAEIIVRTHSDLYEAVQRGGRRLLWRRNA